MDLIYGTEKRFYEFTSNLTDKDKIAIIAHHDLDGITSAVIASKVIGNPELVIISGYNINFDKLIAKLKEKKINKILVLDFNIFENKERLKKFNFPEILIIDHHQYEEDLNSERVTLIKAETEYPASYMCYYLFSKIQTLPSWIPALGTLSDTIYAYNPETAINVFRDFNLPDKINLWNYVKNLNYALIYLKNKEEQIYNLILKAKSIEELKIMDKYKEKVIGEVEKQLDNFEKNKEEFKDLIYFYYKPRYDVGRELINTGSVKYFNKTLIIVQEFKGEINIGARRQDKKVDCSQLLKQATKDIPNSSAGGHMPAAGGEILPNYVEKFKTNLLRLI